ncbi:4828_t:CDS:2 [Racocetra persica]|uniref:4828_t:CDS:1 n=1 Tax=Racocetra persica TaxID=160502 RepID=A0ACA9N2X8_9GLOM|nr:4828_t:CDS:2 [Racocetra persica]
MMKIDIRQHYHILLKIHQTSLQTYTFENLQDLCGRPLLIAKAPTNTKAFINEKTLDDDKNEETLDDDNNEEILDDDNNGETLDELGHFKYRDFQAFTHTTQDMEEFTTYFEFFMIISHVIKMLRLPDQYPREMFNEICHDKAVLPDISSDVLEISLEPENYYNILSNIGTILHGILSQIPITQRKMTIIVNDETVNAVRQGNLFIAKCNNKFKVPNIIMSLCNLHNKCYPESWQVLICKSSTTEEELLTFTKQCFVAAKNEYGIIYFSLQM